MSADDMIDALRKLEAFIPDYSHLTNDEIIALRRAATLDPDWVTHAVNAVGASTTVQTILNETDEGLRDEITDITRWETVEMQLKVMHKGVHAANLVRRHRIGLKMLQAYGIIRQLIRQPEHRVDLQTHFGILQEMNKTGPRKKKTDEPDPVTE